MITERERREVRESWPKPSLVYRLLEELEAAEGRSGAAVLRDVANSMERSTMGWTKAEWATHLRARADRIADGVS